MNELALFLRRLHASAAESRPADDHLCLGPVGRPARYLRARPTRTGVVDVHVGFVWLA